MIKKIIGFIFLITIGGFILLFTLKQEHKMVVKFPRKLVWKEMIKLYLGNLIILSFNLFFWFFVIKSWL